MELEIGQKWESETHPHENFEIYDRSVDSYVLSDMGISVVNTFDELPETAKLFFWQRTNKEEFDQFLISKKGKEYDTTYPYAWAGESKKKTIMNKINKYNMKLSNKN
jgi:hypothetical protein